MSALPHEGMFHPVALSFEEDEMAVMDEPVNHGGRHLVICKDIAPFREFKVCCQDKAFAFIAVRNDSEQHLGAIFINGDIAPFVEYQQIQGLQFAD